MKKAPIVYIIDDDPSALKGIVRLLTAAGFNVQAFLSAEIFLDTINENITGCLILDVRLPGTTIEDINKELKLRNTKLNILVISADDIKETRLRAKEINAKGFFRKPIDGNALIDAIHWILKSDMKENNRKSTKQGF